MKMFQVFRKGQVAVVVRTSGAGARMWKEGGEAPCMGWGQVWNPDSGICCQS